MKIVRGGITAPAGFLAGGVFCGIKRRGKDLAMIFSELPAAAAGTLTTNALEAPCVAWSRKVLKRSAARAIVANSGNANCCTGRRGLLDTQQTARWSAQALGISSEAVLVASTGVIGRPLPMNRLRKGIRQAASVLSRTGSLSAVEAIMTTDTRPKEIAVRFALGGRPVTVGGIAKGSGMVSPKMATMLAFLTTDARVEAGVLRSVLRAAVEESFNSITIDGEMSTNDMVLILANGASGTPAIRPGSGAYRNFVKAVRTVAGMLAHEIVRDGEGVTRLLKVQVTGAADRKTAEKVARRVANSLLVKTMVTGRDPNWGRVAAAVGSADLPVDPARLRIRLGKLVLFRNGEPVRVEREKLLQQMDEPEVEIEVDLGQGSAQARVLGGDLTEGYVRINAKYTS